MATLGKPAGSAAERAVEGAHGVAVSVVAIGVAFAVLYYGRVFFITSIAAVIIAFILEPFVTLVMRARMPRGLSAFLVCTVALLLLYAAVLGAYAQLTVIYQDLPNYGQRIGDLVDGFQLKVQELEQRTYRAMLPGRQRQIEEERIRQQAAAAAAASRSRRGARAAVPPVPLPEPASPDEQRIPISDFLFSRLGSFYEMLLMASFVPFLVYFMLSWRDHINRSFLQFFHGEDRMVAARSLQGIAEMVRAFVVGNFVLGLVLSLASTLAFSIARLPYPFLVGPLSGFLSLVPYVGLPLAILPPLFSALKVNTVPLYLFVVGTVALLHLIALNVLYPKIVGARVHLNPLVVTFSLMLWGFMWGAAGLLLAIPLTAGLKAVCDNVRDLRPIGKFLGD